MSNRNNRRTTLSSLKSPNHKITSGKFSKFMKKNKADMDFTNSSMNSLFVQYADTQVMRNIGRGRRGRGSRLKIVISNQKRLVILNNIV